MQPWAGQDALSTLDLYVVNSLHKNPCTEMDQDKKLKLVEALASSKAKGNAPLAEAVRVALEEGQASQKTPKAA